MTRDGKWIVWAGRVVSIAPVFILLWSARMKLTHNAFYFREWQRIGYPPWELNGIGAVQVTCLILYLIPQTAVLGTVLLTGYLGGATATQVRLEDPWFLLLVVIGVLVWGALWLRDPQWFVLHSRLPRS